MYVVIGDLVHPSLPKLVFERNDDGWLNPWLALHRSPLVPKLVFWDIFWLAMDSLVHSLLVADVLALVPSLLHRLLVKWFYDGCVWLVL
jgi:hypothetical protein